MHLTKLAFFLICASIPGFAQTGTGSIQGTVKDTTGAVVPSANIKVVHVATSREFNSLSNESGIYLIPAMQSGAYQISVE